MKNIVILISLVTSTLLASKIELNIAEIEPKRVVPNNMTEVLSFAPSVKDTVKSVVNISTTQHSHSDKRLDALMNDPYFRYFFGQQNRGMVPKERAQRALGSGVILSKDGYIVTNNHVIDNADEITVTLPHNKKEYKAVLVGQDKESDLAVIKIDAENLTPIMIGDANGLEVGDVVFAVGNPFGVGETVTQGIISALNKNRVGINQYENFIQTDASINPGNSGGALVDSRGVLIGLNSAILSRSGSSAGVGFAIPIDMVQNVVENLVANGKVTRGYIGVSITDLNKQLLPLYEKQAGAVVVNVEKGGPASEYGLKRGDLVYKIGKKEVENASDLKHIIASYKPEDRVTMYIERDKKEKVVKIVLGNRHKSLGVGKLATTHKGLKLGELSRANRERYRIPSTVSGILVEDVYPKSEAEQVGFQSGDVIIQVENKNIDSMLDLTQVFESYPNSKKRVYVNRYGMILMFVID
jgi:serine protease Do